MPSAVQIREQDGVVIATFPPEIDLSNISGVRAQVFGCLQSSAIALIIDLSHSTYLNSKGILLLMELEERLQKTPQLFRLVVPLENAVARLLDIAGVPILRHATVDAALQDILNTTWRLNVVDEMR